MKPSSSEVLVPATKQSPALPAKAAPPTPTVSLIARLQACDVAAVEAALVSVGDAYREGDPELIAGALLQQVTLLETLAVKLITMAGSERLPTTVHTYGSLGLKALDQARKTLLALADLRSPKPGRQTNVQVNVGTGSVGAVASVGTNEVLEADHE